MSDTDDLDGLRDPVLRRALDHAPDRAAEPSHELRRRIQKAAHRAVEPKPEVIDLDESVWGIWWRRWRGNGGGRMPWGAAFATVLVAGFVTLLWHREPVPEARLDGDKSTAQVPAPVPVPSAAPESSAPPPSSPPQELAPAAPAAPEAPGPAAEVPPQPVPAEPPAISMAPSAGAPPSDASAPGIAPPAGAPAPLARQGAQPPSTPGQSPARGAADELPPDDVRESESKAKAAAAPPPPPAAAALPKPVPLPPVPAPAPAAPAAPSPEAAAPQRAAPPGTRNEGTAPPTFAALSQWRRATILRTDGASRNVAREEVGDLVPLLGSAALVAVSAQPLPDEVEWRVVLERANGDRLAVLDIAGNWVRWREGRAPPGTGAPSAGALAALRAGLREALER